MDDADERMCCWCDAQRIQGKREDVGRPLTEKEKAAGFLACHEECRPKLRELFASLASKGVYVEIEERGP